MSVATAAYVVAAAAAAYGASETKRQGDYAKGQVKKEEKAALNLKAQKKAKERQAAFMIAKKRGGRSAGGRSDVLTGPGGVTGQSPQGKALLGL
jgi:hypothetical protein